MKQKNILTEKETKIVQLICMEYINQRIADELGLSKRTVEDYRERIKKKINAKNTAGIVMYAIQSGIFKIK
ncbi:MAG TPA: LuxR C-terminal-related transcriptional regulator [Chitinophagaceae bacterium]|jgi:Response regulator containing a CheY-like receiver domain and an HTH DNA-binding domain